MTDRTVDEINTDERLDSLERFRDVEFTNWKSELERRFAEAFPGGDHVGHCRYHQLMIEDIDAKKKLRQAVMEKTISGLVWAGVVAIGIAAWQWFKTQVRG